MQYNITELERPPMLLILLTGKHLVPVTAASSIDGESLDCIERNEWRKGR